MEKTIGKPKSPFRFSAGDIYTLAMLVLYTAMALVFVGSIERAELIIFQNLFLSAVVVGVSYFSSRKPESRGLLLFRRIYFVPFIFLIYSQIQVYIKVINPSDYDSVLISWDKMLLGVNPTEWLEQFINPYLTEYLQFCYMMFFIMPLAQGIELHIKGKNLEFSQFIARILMGFYVSYLLYLIMPAIGPRFCVHDFSQMDIELPGIWLAEHFRHFINAGGGVPFGATNAAELVNRDCMPSGHTMMTIMNIFLGFRNRSHLRYVFLIIGSSLIFSTVYLRYHYFVDLLAGAFFAILVLTLEPRLNKYLSDKKIIRN